MSADDIREIAKKHATEAVAEALEVSDRTKVKTSLRNAYLIVVTIVGATAAVCAYLNRLSNSQERMEEQMAWKVPEEQLVDTMIALERGNRDLVHKDGSLGLNGVDPRLFRPAPPSSSSSFSRNPQH
jgi:hypothetical protein